MKQGVDNRTHFKAEHTWHANLAGHDKYFVEVDDSLEIHVNLWFELCYGLILYLIH